MERINFPIWEDNKKTKCSDIIFISIVGVLIALMMAFMLLNTFVFMNIEVSGDSMCNTLQSGDLLVANKNKKPKAGDVVIIANVREYLLIKRVIAIGDEDGTIVEIKNGAVFVDGEELKEDYALGETYPSYSYYYKWNLQENEVFYLGDNRQHSADARQNGPCDITDVVAVVENWAVNARGFIKVIYFIPMQLSKLFGGSCSGNVK